jgi:hypothetical protein
MIPSAFASISKEVLSVSISRTGPPFFHLGPLLDEPALDLYQQEADGEHAHFAALLIYAAQRAAAQLGEVGIAVPDDGDVVWDRQTCLTDCAEGAHPGEIVGGEDGGWSRFSLTSRRTSW